MHEKVKVLMCGLQGQGGSGGGGTGTGIWYYFLLYVAFWWDIYVASLKLMLVLVYDLQGF